jgi:hypothetical protein
VILVGVKQGGPDRVEIHLGGSDEMPTHWDLYQTTPQLNCVKTEEVGGKDGVARVDIPGESIFTLVGKIEDYKPAHRQ